MEVSNGKACPAEGGADGKARPAPAMGGWLTGLAAFFSGGSGLPDCPFSGLPGWLFG